MNRVEDEMKMTVGNRRFEAGCYKHLKERNLPVDGWYCESVEDKDEAEFTCQLCGYREVRYVHWMQNPSVVESFGVGCCCDATLTGDALGALEREREVRNRTKRLQSFIHGKWKYSTFGDSHFWERKIRNGPRCKIRQDANHLYAVWYNEHWCYKCRGKLMLSFREAAKAIFTVSDPKRMEHEREND